MARSDGGDRISPRIANFLLHGKKAEEILSCLFCGGERVVLTERIGWRDLEEERSTEGQTEAL